jgi:hypothetical protein
MASHPYVEDSLNRKRGRIMADDKTKSGRADRQRINVREDYELRDWSRKFDTSIDELKDAVKVVGPMVLDVERYLKKR